MSDREKLIELLSVSEEYSSCYGDIDVGCTGCEYEKEEDCFLARLADHLISNGVTVQKWIPVSERLPKDSEAELEYSVTVLGWYHSLEGEFEEWRYVTSALYDSDQKLWRFRDGALNALLDIKDKPRCGEFVTHWMPLPDPPKECE